MENLYTRIRNLKLLTTIKKIISTFSKTEKIVFLVLVVILFVSTVGILQNINKSFMVTVPHEGGTVTEGILGVPRFINPVLASSDADRDLSSLVYSGLMRKNPSGNLILDLAKKYDVSKDGLNYTFVLKENAFFQDGNPISADDIIFTVNKIKDPIIKSPIKGNWEGIEVKKIGEKTVQFTLREPYASFLENTTLGIMPAYIWEDSPIELNEANTNPIGSGPYQINKIKKKSSGTINYYELISFKKFILGKPYIKKIKFKFYQNEEEIIDALLNKEVDQISSISPKNALDLKERGYRVESSVLPRIFGIFFNQNQNNLFTDKNIIRAIDEIIDKDEIVNEVLLGYGIVIDGPIPPNMINYQRLNTQKNTNHNDKVKKAEAILLKDGWKKNEDGFLEKTISKKKNKTTIPLEFSISTGNAKELSESALLVKKNLEEVGIKVNIKTFEIGNLNQNVIRPRKYDALLFGQIINSESDLFAFWHSSQRNDPGINVAMYTNAKTDKILEDAFVTLDEQSRIKKYAQFEDEIKKDRPAVFLYSPSFIYIVSKNLNGLLIDHIVSPRDRFLNAYLWYTETDNVWSIFSK